MSTKLMWLSRHTPTPRQRSALTRIFGADHQLTLDHRAFDGADDIIARFRASGCDELIVVAPDAVIRAIIARGIRPIKAEMRPVPCDNPAVEVRTNTRTRPRCYAFVRFGRISSYNYTIEPLSEEAHDEIPA